MPSVRDIPLETGYPDILTRRISARCACRRNQPKQSTLLSQGLPCCNFHLYSIGIFYIRPPLKLKGVCKCIPLDTPFYHKFISMTKIFMLSSLTTKVTLHFNNLFKLHYYACIVSIPVQVNIALSHVCKLSTTCTIIF